MSGNTDNIHTKIWEEVATPEDPFSAQKCYLSGFDVYGELIGQASLIEYLFVLFQLERPTIPQQQILATLAIAIGNPGPRDASVRAAMNAGVGGSTNAACLMAAIAVGAGNLGGARDVFHAMTNWENCGTSLALWETTLKSPRPADPKDTWPQLEHPAGFDPYASTCAEPVRATLKQLSLYDSHNILAWLYQQRIRLEALATYPLAMSGLAAAALHTLGFTPEQGEMLYLLLRLPGAAAHALEQKELGWKQYPLWKNGLTYHPPHAPQQRNKTE